MDLAEKLYKNGLTLDEIAFKIYESKMDINKLNWGSDYHKFTMFSIERKKPQIEYIISKGQKLPLDEPYPKDIYDLINKVLDAICDLARREKIIATGFNKIESNLPVIINPREWLFLKIDIKDKCAYCPENSQPKYRGIRFFMCDKLTSDELDKLNSLLINKIESKNTKSTNPQNKKNEAISNDFEFSGLLKIPKNAGNWAFAIDDMARDLFKQNGKLPNKAEAWGQLCTSPPDGYSITVGKDKRLNMPSADPLTQRAFNERWKRYTK